MALLTTLIPAYRITFLDETLRSLARQTWRNFRVLVGDDSPGRRITEALCGGELSHFRKVLDITVLPGPGNLFINHEMLIDAWNSSSALVHFLHDDDVVMPDFYRNHVRLHSANDLHLTISARSVLSSVDSVRLPPTNLPPEIEDSPLHVLELDGHALIRSILGGTWNWAGEPSNMVLSAKGATLYPRLSNHKVNYFGLIDLGMVFECARIGKIGLIRDHLSLWRMHGEQSSFEARKSHGWRNIRLCWVYYAAKAWTDEILRAGDFEAALRGSTRLCQSQMPNDPTWQRMKAAIDQREVKGLEWVTQSVASAWFDFLAENKALRLSDGQDVMKLAEPAALTGG
jgi:hypothetical protein